MKNTQNKQNNTQNKMNEAKNCGSKNCGSKGKTKNSEKNESKN